MALSTSMVSGLSSGIDWRTIIDQLYALEHKRVELVEERRTTYQDRLSAWQSINTKLLSLKTTAGTLNKTTNFNLYATSLASSTSTDADDILAATASTDASPGTYDIVVKGLAAAQKLSSTSYANVTAELNLSGDIIVGSRTVKIASTDTLNSLRDKINAVNTGIHASGVTASIVDYGTSGYRLILTSDQEGAEGISLLNGESSNLIGTLGFVDASAKTAKNTVTGGHKSDAFAHADKTIGGSDLLNLSAGQTGTVTLNITVGGTLYSADVAINLSSTGDSLNNIATNINNAFAALGSPPPSDPASVVSETVDGTTQYRLLIEGNAITYSDTNNVLETLGVLERTGVSDEIGVIGDVSNTSGGSFITSLTRFDEVDGYIDYATTDTIMVTGIDTNGNDVNTSFSIYDTDYKTIGDFLAAIETAYGDVTASITEDGKIQVVDNEVNDTDLQVILTPSRSSLNFDADDDFGTLATIRKREIQAGADAHITVDGVNVYPTSNTVDDVITGVTLNLKKVDAATVTLTVKRDYDAVKEKIEAFVTAYNEVMDAVNAQLAYDSEKEAPGGPLFGDSSLRAIRSNLLDIIINKVDGVSDDFSTLGLIGISIGTNSKLTMDDTTLEGYLETNFEDVKRLFAADWSSDNSHLNYVYHTYDTLPGTYNINVTGVDPTAGYFVTSGDAEGIGEYLTGISGDAEGLMIRYSGTATGTVGSFSLTLGVAELFDRALYHITDSVDGFVANKAETIQYTIDRLGGRIATMEERIDQKMTVLMNQFIAMEQAMSTLQSQSDWLVGQLDASFAAWGW